MGEDIVGDGSDRTAPGQSSGVLCSQEGQVIEPTRFRQQTYCRVLD